MDRDTPINQAEHVHGSGWQSEPIDSNGDVGRNATAIVYGGLHVFYYDAIGKNLKHAWYGGSWQSEPIDSPYDVGQYATATVYGTPHVFYYDATGGDLRHAWLGSTWSTETLDGAAGTPGNLDANVL